jgi:hypothetical protein
MMLKRLVKISSPAKVREFIAIRWFMGILVFIAKLGQSQFNESPNLNLMASKIHNHPNLYLLLLLLAWFDLTSCVGQM